jgi:class 3 adenylate cyclase
VVEIPSGTVTLLFTDIEGSTRLAHQLGEGYGACLNGHRELLRSAVAEAGGYEVDCRADELFASFQRAKDGVAAALAVQRNLATRTWSEGARVRVRIGLHTGEPAVEDGAYLGLDVSRAARICSAAHGGQILLSETTRNLVADTAELKDLGTHSLAGLPRPERIFQLLAPGLQSTFPPLRGESAEPGLLKKILPSRRARVPSLEEEAWQARTLLTKVPQARQKPLTELGAALFTADRAVSKADNLLSRIDRKGLARRIAAQRESAVVSRVAQQELVWLERQATSVDRLLESRQALAALAAELPGRLDETLAERGIASLRERVAAATAELDEALAQAASALDPLTFKLQRTRHRGVYRSGRKFIVPFVDTVGVDRRREFSTLAEAHDFKQAIRHADNALSQAPEPEGEFPVDTWGGIGGVGGGTGP